MNLTGTSHKLQIVTVATCDVDVRVSGVLQTSSAMTPFSSNYNITTSTTTDIVSSPGSGEYKAVNALKIRNEHASDAVSLTLQHTDGSTVAHLWSGTLAAGESMQSDGKTFEVLNSAGRPVVSNSGGPVDVQSFTSAGAATWTKPTSFTPKFVRVICYGGGGGGGGGSSNTGAVVRSGGCGGGGGARASRPRPSTAQRAARIPRLAAAVVLLEQAAQARQTEPLERTETPTRVGTGAVAAVERLQPRPTAARAGTVVLAVAVEGAAGLGATPEPAEPVEPAALGLSL